MAADFIRRVVDVETGLAECRLELLVDPFHHEIDVFVFTVGDFQNLVYKLIAGELAATVVGEEFGDLVAGDELHSHLLL